MKLSTKHLFPFIRMINKLNIKNEFKEFYSKKVDLTGKTDEEKEQITQDKGVDFVFMLLEKLPNAEKEVFVFLSLFTGKSVEELQEAGLMETVDLLKSVFQDPSFSSFFQQAVK